MTFSLTRSGRDTLDFFKLYSNTPYKTPLTSNLPFFIIL
jgi:hypothetical protein